MMEFFAGSLMLGIVTLLWLGIVWIAIVLYRDLFPKDKDDEVD